jgi:hypothetical protein
MQKVLPNTKKERARVRVLQDNVSQNRKNPKSWRLMFHHQRVFQLKSHQASHQRSSKTDYTNHLSTIQEIVMTIKKYQKREN